METNEAEMLMGFRFEFKLEAKALLVLDVVSAVVDCCWLRW